MKTRQQSTLILLLILVFMSLQFQSCDLFDSDSDDSEDGLNWITGITSPVSKDSIYVSIDGNDSSDGKSVNNPLKTLGAAFSKVHPGGRIFILGGTYKEGLGLQKFGSSADTITIEGITGSVILDGENERTIGIYAEDCHNLVFKNITIQNYTDVGLAVSTCNGLTIQNMTVKNNGHAVKLTDWEFEGYGIHVDYSQNVLIEGVEALGNGPHPKSASNIVLGTGINTYGNENVIIRDNSSHDNTGGGLLIEDSDHVLAEGNELYGNDGDASVDGWWDAGLWLDGGSDVILKNNHCYNNIGAGIEVSDEDRQSPTGYILENNICTENTFGIFIWNFGSSTWPDSSIITSISNQFSNNVQQDIWIVDWF
ncbi:MAG: right-handed parallel beta-helix repeat-containing protein [Candidatus Marinimicrobia bacterium]|jgi:parallel beta-helix repeat protein|nr:right-handed parallel beta-helix repeat-containing protein [Candidatus Neomarinimicrobiota bacterium]MBT4361131.1 right-handed parallel beta-helix repeat-containing protein [Candidatus Neomarinimicrobiota bacterium]MBT4714147.1 right-handed parallel beta-helix repeat-containing protein [Candidatus Neomarinimicrobiota bacterium]MBT4946038.1 right-handed parallel beta-helix repeat-containing protein [Candidatus Neomarinimicrobiota bacterium]MBT5314119.1 right-handed parallel beta-helix repeat-